MVHLTQGQGIEFTTGGVEGRMGEEETLLAAKEALAYLRRIERVLETMAENMQEYLETSRQLLASPALRADVAEVDVSRVTYSAAQMLTIRELTINPVEHMVTFDDQPIGTLSCQSPSQGDRRNHGKHLGPRSMQAVQVGSRASCPGRHHRDPLFDAQLNDLVDVGREQRDIDAEWAIGVCAHGIDL